MADDSDNECDLDLLNELLNNEDDVTDENQCTESTNYKKAAEFDFLADENNLQEPKSSELHTGYRKELETHSSDEEDKDYFQKTEYSQYGQGIKQLLKQTQEAEKHYPQEYSKPKNKITDANKKIKPLTTLKKSVSSTEKTASSNVYSDPFFGYGINKPLISSAELAQLMQGRKTVPIISLKQFLASGKPTEDWVVAGILTCKSPTKKTSKGDNFGIWKLCNLSMNMDIITLFVFGNAYKNLCKVSEGSVLGILNANVMESRDSNDLATLSVDNAAKVMIIGTSRDMGICKSKKRNGDNCTNVVNTRLCEFCIYHVKNEYSKHTKRSDLQSSFNGKGITMSGVKKDPFQNAQLNKYSSVDQNFQTIPAKKSHAMITKDRDRLEKLKSNATVKVEVKPQLQQEIKPKAKMVELTQKQSQKDMKRLNKLKQFLDTPTEINKETEEKIKIDVIPQKIPKSLQEEKNVEVKTSSRFSALKSRPVLKNSSSPLMAPKKVSVENINKNNCSNNSSSSIILSKLSQRSNFSKQIAEKKLNLPLMIPKNSEEFNLDNLGKTSMTPKLGVGSVGGFIDLSTPSPKRKLDSAKQSALEWVRKNGAIKPSNPNKTMPTKDEREKNNAKRRKIENEKDVEDKKSDKDSFAEEYKKLMEMKSSHADLVEIADDKEKNKYFNKMESKEKLEIKMLNTFQVPCKAVHCKVCKYTSFSASDICKENRHPLKVYDAVKKFYKCYDCGNRTVTIDRIPAESCSKCNSMSWVKAAMMDERKTQVKTAHLSIRGDEEKYFGASNTNNLNLIVPE